MMFLFFVFCPAVKLEIGEGGVFSKIPLLSLFLPSLSSSKSIMRFCQKK